MNSKLFDDWSKQYEADLIKYKEAYPFAGYFDIVTDLIQMVKANKAQSIVDLGVGSGYMLNQILEHVPQTTYYGIDFSDGMLAIAKTKLAAERLIKHDIGQATIPTLLGGKKMDVLLSAYTMHHFTLPQKMEIIKCYVELLKDTGLFIIADISFDHHLAWTSVKNKEGKQWDEEEEEGYFLADVFMESIRKTGMQVKYIKKSFCSGIYVISINAA